MSEHVGLAHIDPMLGKPAVKLDESSEEGTWTVKVSRSWRTEQDSTEKESLQSQDVVHEVSGDSLPEALRKLCKEIGILETRQEGPSEQG